MHIKHKNVTFYVSFLASLLKKFNVTKPKWEEMIMKHDKGLDNGVLHCLIEI